MLVAIIDYGSGNLRSASKAFERAAFEAGLNCEIKVTDRPEHVLEADRVVLPGVGAFADCRQGLENITGMMAALETSVRQKAKPFLGICVGLQLMATAGFEYQETPGFDWIKGEVHPIEPNDKTLKIPHMGWNTLDINTSHAVLNGIKTGPQGLHAYFVHSYHFVPEDDKDIIATSDYGGPVCAMIGRDNMIGTQFHPEKSQKLGLALITNFLKWVP